MTPTTMATLPRRRTARARPRRGGPGRVGGATQRRGRIAQLRQQLGGAGVPIARQSLDRLHDDRLQRRFELGDEVGGGLGIFVGLGAQERVGVGALKGEVLGEHLVQHRADGVDVGAGVATTAADLFGGHVVGRAERRGEAGPGEAALRFVERDPEIEDLHFPVGGEEDVLGLDVAVNDPFGVQITERLRDLTGDVERAFVRQRRVRLDDAAERASVDVLHRDVHPALLARLQHLDDVGVIELLPHLLLALEALEEDDVALQLRVRDLERDLGAAVAVDRLEDRRHSAAGQELAELVLVELFSDDGLAHQRSARADMAGNLA